MTADNHSQTARFIWRICNLLRGPYKRSEYRKVVLPLTVLRRFDCLLEPTKEQVLDAYPRIQNKPETVVRRLIEKITGRPFYNLSKLDFPKLLNDSDQLAQNLVSYINGFSSNVREIIERFKFEEQVHRMQEKNLLYQVVEGFSNMDFSPRRVDNVQMGYVFEELIRIGAEQANEEAGEHFTPREVIRLMVNLLLAPEEDLRRSHVIKTIYDPACGTGGMLSVAEKYIRHLNSEAEPHLYGQDWNDESWAVCRADMLIKGEDAENIVLGDTLTRDGFDRDTNGKKHTFDYMLANPPFGVEWRQQQTLIKGERDRFGYQGRFGAGLPRISDGSLLFLQHMLSKMRPRKDGGSRIGIVLNGSPLFAGEAGGGESSIRQWIIESDWLEAVIALPDQLFYNTSIATYLWILSNRKEPRRKGKVQLIDARCMHVKMPKSLGKKRNKLGDPADRVGEPDQIADVTRLLGNFKDGETRVFSHHDGVTTKPIQENRVVSKVVENDNFGYRKIVLERPLRLNFRATPTRITQLEIQKGFKKLEIEGKTGLLRQDAIRGLLFTFAERHGAKLYRDRPSFIDALSDIERSTEVRLSQSERKAVLSALGERDPSAEICRDRRGDPEPDPQLRDTEIVPMKECIDEFFQREVLPYFPDAWINHDKTKIGYEIPLNHYFYHHAPLRTIGEIETDIETLGDDILGLLAEQRALVERLNRRQAGRILRTTDSDIPLPPATQIGLDSRPALTARGIERLGDIPKHWDVRRLKQVCQLAYGDSLGPEYRNEGDVPVFGSNGRFGTHCIANTLQPVIVIGRKGSFGKINFSKSRVFATDTTYFIDRRHTSCDLRWLYYALQTLRLDEITKDSAVPGLAREDAYASLLAVPPVAEQRSIADFLDREMSSLDLTVSRIESAIKRLLEFRNSLLTRSVTGALDRQGVSPVRGSDHAHDVVVGTTVHEQSVAIETAEKEQSTDLHRQRSESNAIHYNTESSVERSGSMDGVSVKPSLLTWARERANYSLQYMSAGFPNIAAWERGEGHPTFWQLQAFADATNAPIGFLFLPEPPDETMPIPDLRGIAKDQSIRPSPSLLDTIYLSQEQQNWYREFLHSVHDPWLKFVGSARVSDDVCETAGRMRKALGIDTCERATLDGWKDGLRLLIEQADAHGILVMVSTDVGGDTLRSLDPQEFRGFTLADPWAPLVFVNGSDTMAVQMFTLAHEFAHLWLGESGISDADARAVPSQESERWCSRVAAEFLVPEDEFQDEYDSSASLESELNRLAHRFNVSSLVMLRRIHDIGRLSRQELRVAYDAELSRVKLMCKERDGILYPTFTAGVSKRFARELVVSALEGHTGFTEAFRMLGLKRMASFERLRRTLGVG